MIYKGTGQFVKNYRLCNPVFEKTWFCLWTERSRNMHIELLTGSFWEDSEWWQKTAFLFFFCCYMLLCCLNFFFNLNYIHYFYNKFWCIRPKRNIVMYMSWNSSFEENCLLGSIGLLGSNVGKLTGFIKWWKQRIQLSSHLTKAVIRWIT